MHPRIFDHLDPKEHPEDRKFSRVAHRMRQSTWWPEVPTYAQPEAVAGEIVRGLSAVVESFNKRRARRG